RRAQTGARVTARSINEIGKARRRFITSDYSGLAVSIRYPPARVEELVETIHGVPVADPYRWLEDPDSLETNAWIEAQNALTRSMLAGPDRDALVRELTGLVDDPRTTALLGRGERYVLTGHR